MTITADRSAPVHPFSRPADAFALIRLAETHRIDGRGGARFPLARKVAAMRRPTGGVVIANACEGDPTSRKDLHLLRARPELVLDGLQIVSEALSAARTIIATHAGSPVAAAVESAVSRWVGPKPEILLLPGAYVSSEASAIVSAANGGLARPSDPLTRPTERGVSGRSTLLSNVETFAHVALAVRGELPAVVDGRVRPVTITDGRGTRVVEIDGTRPLGEVIVADPRQWVLTGGVAGTWVRAGDLARVAIDDAAYDAIGASRGVGSYVVLPPDACPVGESARLLRRLAAAGAGQCGPCIFGLPELARATAGLVVGRRGALRRIDELTVQVAGRGACAHPSGTAALAASAASIARAGHRCTERCRHPSTLTALTKGLR